MLMTITVTPLRGRKDLRTFILLPEKIHQGHATWVHPLYMDEWSFFNSETNKSFKGCETILALAWSDEKPVGRVMGIINNAYNTLHQEKNARFCFLECYEDLEIAGALLDYVADWARGYGMQQLVGPLGFSDKDPQGCMIEGFDERVTLVTNHNFRWMSSFYDQLGFLKEVDLVSYISPIEAKVPDYMAAIANRVMSGGKYRLHNFRSRLALRPWIVPIFRLVNETYQHIYGFIPMSEREMRQMARRYLPLLNPAFVKVVTTNSGELVAFLISMPEISNGIRRAKGRLFPFGWFHVLRESRRSTMLTLLLGAVKQQYRGLGIETLMAQAVFQSAWKSGIRQLDSHLILETNTPMRSECERLNSRLHKRFRIYRKAI